jgi:hypothetical protein
VIHARFVVGCMVSASSEPLWTISFRYPKGVNMRSQIFGLFARAVTKMLGTRLSSFLQFNSKEPRQLNKSEIGRG